MKSGDDDADRRDHGARRSCGGCDEPAVAPIHRRRRGTQVWLCQMHLGIYAELSRGRLRQGLDEAMRCLKHWPCR